MDKNSIDYTIPISTHSWFDGSFLNQDDDSLFDETIFNKYDGIFDKQVIINQNNQIIQLLSSIDSNLKKLVDDKSNKKPQPQKKPSSNINHNLEGINI